MVSRSAATSAAAHKSMLEQAIGLGLVLSLVFAEVFGLAAGGMVVPGYVALQIHRPMQVLSTLAVSYASYLLVRFFSNFMFIYGKRRLVLTLLIGFLLGSFSRRFVDVRLFNLSLDLQAIGFIIPGLIANWMERQGVWQTICVLLVAAVWVRLALILITGGVLLP